MTLPLGTFPAEWEKPISHTQVEQGNSLAVFGEDHLLNVHFRTVPYLNEFKSKEAKERVTDNIVHVRIQAIGDTKCIVDRPATPEDMRRFPKQYMAYLEQGKKASLGIPIEIWDYQVSESTKLLLKQIGVEFVHQIANMTDVQRAPLGVEADTLVLMAQITVKEQDKKENESKIVKQFDEVKAQLEASQRAQADILERLAKYEAQDPIEREAKRATNKKHKEKAEALAA